MTEQENQKLVNTIQSLVEQLASPEAEAAIEQELAKMSPEQREQFNKMVTVASEQARRFWESL